MKIVESADISSDKNAKQNTIATIYNAMITITQEIRGTVERLTLWVCGLILLLDGWLTTSNKEILSDSKITISIGIIFFGTISMIIIGNLNKRYNGNARVIRKINELQLLHRKGEYFLEESVFPEEWKKFGSAKWKEPIFLIAYISIPVVTIFGVTIVWVMK